LVHVQGCRCDALYVPLLPCMRDSSACLR
jgi:hypothetical protein